MKNCFSVSVFAAPEIMIDGKAISAAAWVASPVQKDSMPFTLAGTPGTLYIESRETAQLQWKKERFLASDQSFEAFRQRLENRSGASAIVRSLPVFTGVGNPVELDYHCSKRLKNDKPYSAVYHGETLEADPVVLFSDTHEVRLFGWLEMHLHLAAIRVEPNPQAEGSKDAKKLTASAEFHFQKVAPGKTLQSGFFSISTARNYSEALDAHAQRILAAGGFSQPQKHLPLVISSWHYFGLYVDETIVARELDAIRRRRIPCEVYQLDAGYYRDIGDWLETNEKFPGGLAEVTRLVRAHGMMPGIWFSPFMLSVESETARKHPDWFLLDAQGERVPFQISRPCAALDLSRPEVLDWLEETSRKFREFGFGYFKADFTRCMFTAEKTTRLHNPETNLLSAYRAGLEAIRRGIGPDAFLNVCGGHSGALIGIADSQRTGSDTYAKWEPDAPTPAWHRIRNGMFRSWMHRWRYNDPDAAAIRLCSHTLGAGEHGKLSLGNLTDTEAEVMVLHQFLAGGVPALGENIAELQESRLAMMRRVVPSPGVPAELLDPFDPHCPGHFLLRREAGNGIPPYSLHFFLNIGDFPKPCVFSLEPSEVPAAHAGKFFVCDLTENRVLGIFQSGEMISAHNLPAHSCRVLRILPVPAKLAPTPLFIVGGHYAFAELQSFRAGNGISGITENQWDIPLELVLAEPEPGNGNGWIFHTVALPGRGRFFG